MSYQERNIITYIITGMVVMALFTFHIQGLFEAGLLEGPNAGIEIGWATIKLIGGSIIVTIIVSIVVAILNAIITKETDIDASDERDKQIDLLGMKVGFITFSIFFVGLFIGMAFGLSTTLVLVALVYAMWLASIVESVVRLYVYRQGF